MRRPSQQQSGLGEHAGSFGLDFAIALAFGVALFLLVSTTPDIPSGYDAYRHVKMASLLIQDPTTAMKDPWRLAVLWPKPVDPYVGFHLLLAPFTVVFELITAAKVLGSLIFGCTALVLLRLLHHLKLPHRAAWVLIALTGSGITLHRATVSRPFLLAIFLVLLITLCTLKNKPWGVGIASAANAFSYSMFFLAALAPGIWLLMRRDRAALRVALFCGFGTALGMLANPYFPENVHYVIANAGVTGIAAREGIVIGGELWPIQPGWFLLVSLPVVALWAFAGIHRIRAWPERGFGGANDLLLAVSLVALAGSFRIGRTLDFFVPFATLFAAAELAPRVAGKSRETRLIFGPILVLCAIHVFFAYHAGGRTIPVERYRAVSQYLQRHAPGELVINAQWSDYYYLYFWNTENRYFIGIEPTLAYLMDARKYWLWRHISDDELSTCGQRHCRDSERTDLVTAVKDGLHSRFLLTDRKLNPKLESLLDTTQGVVAAFRDTHLTLYRIDR